MASAAVKPARRSAPTPTSRQLLEWSAAAPGDGPALVIDKDARVIKGVRVLGRYSRNSHGLREAANGTEYTPECMREALPLYEGVEVLADHDMLEGRTDGLATRKTPRGVMYVLGVLRGGRVVGDGADACIRSDLHYFGSHPITPRLLEDVERRLGVFGLSHDARAGRERIDRQARRLVIESLKSVASVDLVRKPATSRNLWESRETPTVSTTLRQLLEDRESKLTPARKKWSRWLLEDDLAAPMEAPVEAPADDDPDAALWSGFKAAIMAILDSDAAADEKAKKIAKYIKGHAKLTASTEPADEPVKEDDGYGGKSDDEKTEAVKAENEKLKKQLAARRLVEQAGIKADPALLETLEQLPEASARRLVEREKARGSGAGKPTSAGPPGGGGKAGTTGDGKVPSGKAFGSSIRG